MKAAIMCLADEQWIEALPLVLLGIRTAYKEDLETSWRHLVYGEPLCVPGELLAPTTPTVEPARFIQQLRRHMSQLRPVPRARYSSPATFIYRDLKDATHVFLRQDTISHALDPPYSGWQKVMARTEKTFKISVRGKQIIVSADRVKPAYVFAETRHGTTTTSSGSGTTSALPHTAPAAESTPPTRPPRTTRCGMQCPLSSTIRLLNNFLREGMMWEYPHKCKTALSAHKSGSQSPHRCNKLFLPANRRRAAQRRPGIKGDISSQNRA
jgi:hypothetical protein